MLQSPIPSRYDKYFWDRKDYCSDGFVVRRILEYASFPDLICFPFSTLKKELARIELGRLRTGKRRRDFMFLVRPHVANSNSWEDVVHKLLTARG